MTCLQVHWFIYLIMSDTEALYWIFQCNYQILKLQNFCLILFYSFVFWVFFTIVDILTFSCIVFVVSFTVSPLHTIEFHSESEFISPICKSFSFSIVLLGKFIDFFEFVFDCCLLFVICWFPCHLVFVSYFDRSLLFLKFLF